MKNIKLDTILLFALLIPFIMNYRISPGTTPYWLFGLIFFGLLSYISLDLFFNLKDNLRNNTTNKAIHKEKKYTWEERTRKIINFCGFYV